MDEDNNTCGMMDFCYISCSEINFFFMCSRVGLGLVSPALFDISLTCCYM